MNIFNFLEVENDELMQVSGGSILATAWTVIKAVGIVSGVLYGSYKALEEHAYNKAYDEAYEAEMERLNAQNQ